MRKVAFKSYIGSSKFGNPSFFDCSSFTETDLIAMLNQPTSLIKVSFKIGHQIWAHHMSDLMDDPSDPNLTQAIQWMNSDFSEALASLGYRVMPEPTEIEIS